MNDTTHSILAPSASSRWVKCPASVKLEALYPQDDSDASAEGTLAHEVAASFLRYKPTHDADEDMVAGAAMYLDEVNEIRENTLNLKEFIEEVVDCSVIHEDCYGTPDYFAISDNDVWIIDYKYGHRYVDVFENWQLLAYATGILHKMRKEGLYDATKPVNFIARIVQPRSYDWEGPVREWRFTAQELRNYSVKLQEAAQLAMSPEPTANVTAECRDCNARHSCATLQRAAYHVIEWSTQGAPHCDMPPQASAMELGMIETALEVLKARQSGKEAEVMRHLKNGEVLVGWSLKQGAGRQKWSQGFDDIVALGEMAGVTLTKPALITPKQAIKAGLPESVVAGYSETPMGEIKLVRDNGVLQRKVFNHG